MKLLHQNKRQKVKILFLIDFFVPFYTFIRKLFQYLACIFGFKDKFFASI